MAHPNHADAKKYQGDKLDKMVGHRGEYAPDRAARICGAQQTTASAQGDAARAPEEVFTAAPARQISNYGTVKGK
jgi:hypothetical protein